MYKSGIYFDVLLSFIFVSHSDRWHGTSQAGYAERGSAGSGMTLQGCFQILHGLTLK